MKIKLLVFIICLIPLPLFALYPEIGRFHKSDIYYAQLQYEIGEYYKRHQAGSPSIPLNFYTYEVKEKDSVFSISSILNLSYDTIVSLNGLEHPDALEPGEILLIPNSPGVYISQEPETDLEEIVFQRGGDGKKVFIAKSGKKIPYLYIAGSYLSGKERAFFLRTLFRKPLAVTIETSSFGYRIHPVLGNRHFHTGIDYRAAEGTDVMASEDGVISGTGILGNYGLYIIIDHGNGYQTVYSHLNRVNVKIHDRVLSGQVVAESGNTGVSTGPHLHFEIRKEGIPVDPALFFPGDY
ncbi:MAG: M23 family metallopeptidase [Spirochaetales bacterium]|nr:M23 family metallopeptidase [Spirochaetales bacterium]